MAYRDGSRGGRRIVVELVDPIVRTRAMKVGIGALACASVLATGGVVAPVAALVGGTLVAGLTALATRKLEAVAAASTWITLDEAAREIRVERAEPGSTARTELVLPLDRSLRFVVTGAHVAGGGEVEVVELRRGREVLAEVVKKPDGMVASFAFAYVEDVVRRLNDAIAELAPAEVGAEDA